MSGNPRGTPPPGRRATPVDRRRAALGGWEEPLPTLTGRAWAFGTVLTLADVLPARFAELPADDARGHVLADIDPGWAAQVVAGDVVCVEEVQASVGDAATSVGDAAASAARDAAALAALRRAGVTAIVAQRYAEGLEDAALAAGIVPVTLDAPAFIHTGDRVRVDLEAAKIVNLSSGDRAGIRNLDESRRAAVRAIVGAR